MYIQSARPQYILPMETCTILHPLCPLEGSLQKEEKRLCAVARSLGKMQFCVRHLFRDSVRGTEKEPKKTACEKTVIAPLLLFEGRHVRSPEKTHVA